jgi:hypothetical protein
MKAVVISVLVFAATASVANEAGDELANRTPFRSTASRQAVQDAYIEARRSGTLPVIANQLRSKGQRFRTTMKLVSRPVGKRAKRPSSA